MKNFFSILIFFIISCNSKKKYEGRWTNYIITDYGYNESRNIVISKDSIEFNYPYFDHYNRYSIKIKKNTFAFNNSIFKVFIKKDTLTLNDSIKFVRDDLDTLYGSKPILKIDLPNTSDIPQSPPPPPPPYSPMFDDENLESNFIVLKKDTLYHDDKIISSLELKSIVKPWIENNKVVFSLYDLESTYGKFLEMTAIINSVYQDVRESTSQEKFNKSYKDLTREEVIEMKIKNPMRHIWSYSIPHYNLVVEQNNSFFGLKVNKKM